MRALSVRQPYAEMILGGQKTVEYRSTRTSILGERFYIYASKKKVALGGGVWSTDLSHAAPPPWIVELANSAGLFSHELPTGLLVGTAVIRRCEQLPALGMYAWHLEGVERLATPRKPKGHPQPIWFNE